MSAEELARRLEVRAMKRPSRFGSEHGKHVLAWVYVSVEETGPAKLYNKCNSASYNYVVANPPPITLPCNYLTNTNVFISPFLPRICIYGRVLSKEAKNFTIPAYALTFTCVTEPFIHTLVSWQCVTIYLYRLTGA